GRDIDSRIQSFCGEKDEEVVGVGGESGDESASPFDADEAKSFVVGGIGGYGEHTGEHGALGTVRIDVHDDEGNTGMTQFASGAAADAAESADDVVVFKIVDHAFFPSFSNGVAELEFDDGLSHGADG